MGSGTEHKQHRGGPRARTPTTGRSDGERPDTKGYTVSNTDTPSAAERFEQQEKERRQQALHGLAIELAKQTGGKANRVHL